MVLARYGGGVVAMSGKIAGQAHSRNQAGAIIRAMGVPRRRSQTAAAQARAEFGNLSAAWASDLTQDQRRGWTWYAEAVGQLNRFGDRVAGNGKGAFLRTNQARLAFGLALQANAPSQTRQTSLMFSSIELLGFVPVVVFNVDVVQEAVHEDGGGWMIYSSYPMQAGRRSGAQTLALRQVLAGSSMELVPVQPAWFPDFEIEAGQELLLAWRAMAPDGRVGPLQKQWITAE